MVKISVILTTYNSEDTLRRTLDSIFRQDGILTDFTIELLIADDCSTDSTRRILEQYGLSYFSTERNSGGPNKGRNMCLEAATGDYICFIDHDDEWFPEKTKKQLQFAHVAEVITCGYLVKDSTTGQIRKEYSEEANDYRYFGKNVSFRNKISKTKNVQRHYFGSIFIRNELGKIRFEETYGMVDFDWIARILEDRDSLEISAPLFARYVDGPNLSLKEQYRLNDFEHSLSFLSTYSKVYPELVKLGIKRLHGSLARYYYLMGNMKKARTLFLRSELSVKTLLYYLTTFWGSNFVKKNFNVFG